LYLIEAQATCCTDIVSAQLGSHTYISTQQPHSQSTSSYFSRIARPSWMLSPNYSIPRILHGELSPQVDSFSLFSALSPVLSVWLFRFEVHQKRNDGCGFSGNSDLYGLRIRLGVYFQWTSTFIIYGWYIEGWKDLAESYLGFLAAITARAEPTYAAQVLLLSYIIFGGIYTVMMVGYRHYSRKRIEQTLFVQ
jgi:hypothetical protein